MKEGRGIMPEQVQDSAAPARAGCRQFDSELSAFLEGEDKPSVVAHARECPFCGVILADLEKIRSLYRDLPLEEPPARVWANIRATLAAEGTIRDQVGGWNRWFPRVGFLENPAPIGALASLTVLGAMLLVSPGANGPSVIPGEFTPGVKPAVAMAVDSTIEGELKRTVEEMETSFQARAHALEPALKATYQKGLESLNACIRECLNHCRREPANRLAREYLHAAYAQKAEVLAAALAFDGR